MGTEKILWGAYLTLFERASRRLNSDPEKGHVELLCETSNGRDFIFSNSGKIPFKAPYGHIYAKYPEAWRTMRGQLERLAKAIRNFRRPGHPQEVFRAQVRFWDESGLTVFVKNVDDSKGWMNLMKAKTEYDRSLFPAEALAYTTNH